MYQGKGESIRGKGTNLSEENGQSCTRRIGTKVSGETGMWCTGEKGLMYWGNRDCNVPGEETTGS